MSWFIGVSWRCGTAYPRSDQADILKMAARFRRENAVFLSPFLYLQTLERETGTEQKLYINRVLILAEITHFEYFLRLNSEIPQSTHRLFSCIALLQSRPDNPEVSRVRYPPLSDAPPSTQLAVNPETLCPIDIPLCTRVF